MTPKHDNLTSTYYEQQPGLGGFVSRTSWYIRKQMYRDIMAIAQPTETTKILDVGVTCDRRQESNFFEKLYPYPHNITAVGVEDASFLEQDHPGLTFVRTDGSQLPFPDQSFDLVVSFAVIEHVGSRAQQRAFVDELCRVGKQVYITTPNRWFPVEFHCILPLVHWLPPKVFRQILRWLGKDFWADEGNLNLLDQATLWSLFSPTTARQIKHYRLLGLVSNLMIYTHH